MVVALLRCLLVVIGLLGSLAEPARAAPPLPPGASVEATAPEGAVGHVIPEQPTLPEGGGPSAPDEAALSLAVAAAALPTWETDRVVPPPNVGPNGRDDPLRLDRPPKHG